MKRTTLFILSMAGLVVVGGVWAYFVYFTTPVTPELSQLQNQPENSLADTAAITRIDTYTFKDKSHVYYLSESNDGRQNVYATTTLVGADPESFANISKPFVYAPPKDSSVVLVYYKDRSHVFMLNKKSGIGGVDMYVSVMSNVDVNTFVPLSYWYAKDKNGVYALHYYNGTFTLQPLMGADLLTFTALDESVVNYGAGGYDAKDKNHTYAEGTILAQ